MKKLIIAIFALLAVLAAVGCAKDNDADNAQRINAIHNHLNSSYNGEFYFASQEPVISENEKNTYEYRVVTDDYRQIEFKVYYNQGSWFDRTVHITSDFDYAIADYVVDKSEFADGDYEITNIAVEQVTEELYKLAVEEKRILEEYGQIWFIPLMQVHLVYGEYEFELSFSYTGGKEMIYNSLQRNIIESGEHHHEDHDD